MAMSITKTKVDLSFSGVREYERTKHVHRLHPYLGKFIPQKASRERNPYQETIFYMAEK